MISKHTPIIEVKRRNNETTSALMRRFSRKAQQAGVMRRVLASRFRIRPLSNKKRKKIAIRRMIKRRETEWLTKLGRVIVK